MKITPPLIFHILVPECLTEPEIALSATLVSRLAGLGFREKQIAFLGAWLHAGFADQPVLADAIGMSEDAVAWRFRRIRKRLGLTNSAQLAALLTHFVHEAGCAGLLFSTGRLACDPNREGVR